jgi:hypothetical protein
MPLHNPYFEVQTATESISARVQPTNIVPPPHKIRLHGHLTSIFFVRIMTILISYVKVQQSR